jgi:hypothetical protein
MGYMRHHAIIVSDIGFGDVIEKAHTEANLLFHTVSPILNSDCNGIRSFCIPPDGSKEGWPKSDAGDALRQKFLSMLDKYRYSDKSSPLDWVEVQFGDDDGVSVVTHHSDEK